MSFDRQTPATQPCAVLQPPRPPGRPPTLTAIGLAPELPDPDDSAWRLSAALVSATPSAKSMAAKATTVLDKALAVAAAGAAVAAALSIWGRVLLTIAR